jgi:hypothetical protein
MVNLRSFIIFIPLVLLVFSGCAAVRMAGKVAKASGDVLVESADEEEAKQQGEAPVQAEGVPKNEDTASHTTAKIVVIKKNLHVVNVRPDPSKTKSPIATLVGGDKVEQIETSGDWLKIRINDEGEQIEGWIHKGMVEDYTGAKKE